MLHAEEGLWLVERGMLAVHPYSATSMSPHGATTTAGVSTPVAAKPTTLTGAPRRGEHGQVSISSPGSGKNKVDEGEGKEERGEKEGEMGNIAHEHDDGGDDASMLSSSKVEGTRRQKGEEKEEEEGQDDGEEGGEEAGGRGGAVSGASSSAQKIDPPSSRPASKTSPLKATLLSKDKPRKIPTGEPEQDCDLRKSGKLAPGEHRHGRQKRAGVKRARPGGSGSVREKGAGPTPSVSVGALRETTLSRAGVPWECYRAYAELKRR